MEQKLRRQLGSPAQRKSHEQSNRKTQAHYEQTSASAHKPQGLAPSGGVGNSSMTQNQLRQEGELASPPTDKRLLEPASVLSFFFGERGPADERLFEPASPLSFFFGERFDVDERLFEPPSRLSFFFGFLLAPPPSPWTQKPRHEVTSGA